LAAADDTKKTPLYDTHKLAGAKIVPFGGWLMPVSYTSVLGEHKAVREKAGLFDVSHMGEVFVRGTGAADFIQNVTINDVNRLKDGSGQYSAILMPNGGMIDDLIIYRLTASEFLICVNASNITKDYLWLQEQAKGRANVTVTNESDKYGQLAVQGPNATHAVDALLTGADKAKLAAMNYMDIMKVSFFGEPAYLARTGYTGELGYEMYVPAKVVARCWTALLETANKTGIEPIGLGARDTLRLEACYLLYGNDMNETVSPLEAGIGWATRLEKPDFVGKAALVSQKAAGLKRSSMAFVMDGDGIPRHDMQVFKGNELVGKVTSGSVLPTVGGAGGMALLDPRAVKIGDTIEIDVRGKRKLAKVVKKPLYQARVKG
jgi:aminomethyltransferase